MANTIIFERRLADGTLVRLGSAYLGYDGWRFVPAIASHKPSRRRAT
jgi:hypothetical protein